MLKNFVRSNWFARLDLLLVLCSSLIWLIWPDEVGLFPVLFLLLPWVLRLIARVDSFRLTMFDGLIVIFLITAWIGFWASYDQGSAFHKVLWITASAFLFYALSIQSEKDLLPITSLLFVLGIGISLYFFLTHDFVTVPRKIEILNRLGVWWMNVRPHLSWTPVHPNYISGLAALTGIFGFYPLQKYRNNRVASLAILAGFCVILSALIMATSRGIWMAMVGAAGGWVLWQITNLNWIKNRFRQVALFPTLVLIYLCVMVVVLYVGPANLGNAIDSSEYGTGSRAELFTRSLYFMEDFPIIGGGLASFPGLYSQYVLDIPYFYLINSHNLFLDVFIEQGMFGGVAFLLLYLICIWSVAQEIVRSQSAKLYLFNWLVLSALMIALIHGMVDDYLYNGRGAFLSVFWAGMAMISVKGNFSNQTLLQNNYPARMRYAAIPMLVLAIIVLMNFNWMRATWYADLGAVELDKAELRGFPKNGWIEPKSSSSLQLGEASLQTSIQLDPEDWTANYRLGQILMWQANFQLAAHYLEVAHAEAPEHRGIIKSLGYCYVWLGNMDKAQALLKQIPEARDELDVYITWWGTQGRPDLSKRASMMLSGLGQTAH